MPHKVNSAVAEAEAALESIRKNNGRVNAVFPLEEADVLHNARAADKAIESGDWFGLLHGVPVTVKDCLNIKGLRTTFGSGAFRNNIAEVDSETARRFLAAGPVLLAKNNLSEFCYGFTNENVHFGNCNNPWDLERIPGGSSGGSAASVAAGMCRISMGSDTGGSVRVPAALCGVAGLRPTVGSFSNRDALELSTTFDVIGPLSYNVADLARTFAAVAGYDPHDHQSVDIPVSNFLPTLKSGVGGVKLGIPRRFFFDDLQPEVGARVMDAARQMEQLGARIVEIDVTDAEVAQEKTMFNTIAADLADVHHERMEKEPETIGAEVLRRLKLGLTVGGMDYSRSLRWLLKWKVVWRSIFDQVDLVLVPTTSRTAPRRADSADMIAASKAISRNAFGIGAVGLPSMSVPCGFDNNGMPVGMLLVARWFDEPALFRAGVAYQSRTEFHRARPRL